MKIQPQPHGNATLLAAHGPLVREDLADLRRSVTDAAARTKHVVVDLADVPYLDSSGIELLLELAGAQLPALHRPKLAALSETCLEALELTDTLAKLEVFDTVENALRACRQ